MCLAIPSRIIKIEKTTATVDVNGVKKEISLLLLDDAKVGEYVIVHAGYAINKVDEKEAIETLKIFSEVALRMERKENGV